MASPTTDAVRRKLVRSISSPFNKTFTNELNNLSDLRATRNPRVRQTRLFQCDKMKSYARVVSVLLVEIREWVEIPPRGCHHRGRRPPLCTRSARPFRTILASPAPRLAYR